MLFKCKKASAAADLASLLSTLRYQRQFQGAELYPNETIFL